MDSFAKTPYRGEISFPGGRARFDKAGPEDVPRLAELYRGVAVTRENYREAFDPRGARSFCRVGGMFTVHGEESIRAAMRDSFFAVARREGRIEASFWVTGSDPDFEGFRPDPSAFPDPERRRSLCAALEAGRAAYPRELIVPPDSRVPKASLLLFYTIFQALQRRGFTHSLGVVYQLRGWSDGGGEHPLLMRNDRSFAVTRATGGLVIGALPVRERRMDGYTVQIEPIVFDFDYELVRPRLERLFTQSRISVRFDWEGAP